MAFNFNWSPLAADASFYTRAQELLTAALNKSPKPPIIVDDILVTELNLGSVPPELEILEIGDLAEDRFRGIFKMKYSGDAFLTLRTRVQANPLNTFLSTRPSFASPDPLAASSGLTIPLKITLSDIKLSAFIILVFSRQKGVTLVFRNDPLESLKVSSTFDSIPFVRDYLQKEISSQLRTLLINEVPAIIHRLSLRLFVPEYRAREDDALARSAEQPATEYEPVTDPLASPPQDPVDARGNTLDPAQVAHWALDALSTPEAPALFSRRTLIHLAALREANRTLSLFTPRLADVVYRAATSPPSLERPAESGTSTLRPSLRSPGSTRRLPSSHASTASVSAFSAASEGSAPNSARPPLSRVGSSFAISGGSRGGKQGRKRKHRVVNLRKEATADTADDAASVSGESSFSGPLSSAATSESFPEPVFEERHGELTTPPSSPARTRTSPHNSRASPRQDEAGPSTFDVTPRPPQHAAYAHLQMPRSTPRPSTSYAEPADESPLRPRQHSDYLCSEQQPNADPQTSDPYINTHPLPIRRHRHATSHPKGKDETAPPPPAAPAAPFLAAPFPYSDSSSGGVLEQAWMMRMASEIARRMQEQKDAPASRSSKELWEGATGRGEAGPPPAYRA